MMITDIPDQLSDESQMVEIKRLNEIWKTIKKEEVFIYFTSDENKKIGYHGNCRSSHILLIDHIRKEDLSKYPEIDPKCGKCGEDLQNDHPEN